MDRSKKPYFSVLYNESCDFKEEILELNPVLKKSLVTRLRDKMFGHLSSADERKRKFHQRFQEKIPLLNKHPMIKTERETFNHVYSFVIDANNQIWYALRESPDKPPLWKPLYFDLLPTGKDQQIDIIADGKNLMARVIENGKQTIHRKRVLEEKRVKQSDGCYRYIAKGICEKAESTKEWFRLPLIKYLKPKQRNQRLQLDPKATWAMAQAGAFRHHSYDKNGNKHSVWGITTVYEVFPDKIRIHDPFVSIDTTIEVGFPKKNNTEFSLNKVTASGSTIMIFGDETTKWPDGTITTKPLIYSKLLDYDSMGCNPLQIYTMDPKSNIFTKWMRKIPPDDWLQHPLPHGKNEQITASITAVQTGIDHQSVELRIKGIKGQQHGFFYKRITDEKWRFQAENIKVLKKEIVNTEEVVVSEKPLAIGYQVKSTAKNPVVINDRPFKNMICDDFSPKVSTAHISLIDQKGKKINLLLHRRKNLVKAFFGLKNEKWDLILDKGSEHRHDIFKGRHHVSVKIQASGDGKNFNIISNNRFNHFNFKAENIDQKKLRDQSSSKSKKTSSEIKDKRNLMLPIFKDEKRKKVAATLENKLMPSNKTKKRKSSPKHP